MNYVTIGTKEALENAKRPIDYEKKQGDYDKLHPFFQTAVDNLVMDLTQESECEGYNYNQIMNWIKDSDSRVTLHKVLRQIAENNLNRIYNDESDKPINKNTFIKNMYDNLSNIRKADFTSRKNPYIEKVALFICDYFLISRDVLLAGKGAIWSIKEEYLNSLPDGFVNKIKRDDFSTKVVFQEYAKELGVPESEVFITEYAIISKRYNYIMLCENEKLEHLRKAVDNLIDRLLFIQNHKMMLGYPCSECSLCAGGCER